MLKVKQATKRFYNKWLYKATLGIPGVAILRLFKLDTLETSIPNSIPRFPHSTVDKANSNKEQILALAALLLKYDASTWGKRIESDQIDLYSNDKEFFDNICKNFESEIVHAYEPTEDIINGAANQIFVGQYPHKKYKHKAFLLPHKMQDSSDKQSYIQWIDLQGDKILMSDAVKRWFLTTNWNWDRRYILVEDESTLLMLKLRGADIVGRIHDYVIVDK